MKPTKLILLALFLLSAAALRAQQAVPVEGIVVATHDTAWYAAQIAAWEQEIRRHPKDETAWQNLFNAVYYRDMLAGRDWTAAADVARRMARKIPGTFTLHYCRFRSGAGPDPDRDLEQALALGADRYYAYDTFIAQLWLKGQFGRIDELARRYFASGYLPTDLLRYNFNEMESLPDGALLIANGDAELIPKVVLQGGLGVHRDKIVVPRSYLLQPAYVEALCAQLGIGSPTLPSRPADWDAATDTVIRYLIEKSGRPVYFAPTVGKKYLAPFSDKLYSEGLVLHYSEHPYDNLAVMKRNVEQRYQLDYLRQRFEARRPWAGETSLRLNYAAALQPLLHFYRASGDATRLNWLTDLLRRAVEGADCDEETKARYRQLLDADRCD